jgi:tRNA(Ile)-lysidine synthase
VLAQVAETISRYSMFERGHTVGVAVSGGADSVCLLHALIALAPRWALRLRVLHLNHRLRGEESEQDAAFVAGMARDLGLDADLEPADVAGMRVVTGENLEQLARRLRRQFFLSRLDTGLVDRVALGHTRSDQAETVLFRILRGSGVSGLAGILPVTKEGFVRPLLEIDRPDVERFLRERNIPWREDASNQDPAYSRNRIRHYLLPSLTREWNPSLPRALAQMAELVNDEEAHWAHLVHRAETVNLVRRGNAVLLRASELSSLERPLARRLLRRAVQQVKGDVLGIEFRHVEAVLKLAVRDEGWGGLDLPGIRVRRSFDWIRLAPPEVGGQTGFCLELKAPCTVELPDGRLEIRIAEGETTGDHGLDADLISWPLTVRNWLPGDCYQPLGRQRPVSCKRLFQQRRIPSWDRHNWPIITQGGAIVWAKVFGPAAGYAAKSLSCKRLSVAEIPSTAVAENFEDPCQRLNL